MREANGAGDIPGLQPQLSEVGQPPMESRSSYLHNPAPLQVDQDAELYDKQDDLEKGESGKVSNPGRKLIPLPSV